MSLEYCEVAGCANLWDWIKIMILVLIGAIIIYLIMRAFSMEDEMECPYCHQKVSYDDINTISILYCPYCKNKIRP